ncbi:MAG: TRAP transporter large permease subunit, partial [Pseudomonadales bacterium]
MVASIVLGMGLPTVAAYVVLATLVPASMIKLGVPAISAHLFIFYFAILSAITPPVCTGAFVAAGIAKANPMQTGFVALRLGLVVFLLPFAFVYEPALLLIGSAGTIVLSVGTAVLGVLYWAFGLEGHFKQPLGYISRATLVIAGGLLIWPNLWVSLGGLVLGGVILVPRIAPRNGSGVPRSLEIDG